MVQQFQKDLKYLMSLLLRQASVRSELDVQNLTAVNISPVQGTRLINEQVLSD